MANLRQRVLKFLSGIDIVNRYFSGIAVIFMLHRVSAFEESKLPGNRSLRISPEFLERFIVNLKSAGYRFISLDELHKILQGNQKTKKLVVFTIDDGYKDVITHAYPIFKKYDVPFTVYLTTSFLDKNAVFWWYGLETLVLENDEVVVGGKTYPCRNYKEKVVAFSELREVIVEVCRDGFVDELNKLFKDYNIGWGRIYHELCMSWDDVRVLCKDELCTIGSHTVNHYALNRLSKDRIVAEIVDANRRIEEKTGRKIEHFAYPFGGRTEVGKREISIVKSLGFKTATTTRHGTIYLEHGAYSNCCLPRIALVEGFDIKDIGKVRRRRIVTV